MSMINEFVEKLIDRLGGLKKAESDREDYSDNHDYYDDWEYAFGDGASYGRHYAYGRSIKIIEELAGEYNDVPDINVGSWIPVSEHYPDTEKYILLSFSNFSIPVVGRWEEDDSGGAFYIGDEDDSCVLQDLYVNAWQPLHEPYKGE